LDFSELISFIMHVVQVCSGLLVYRSLVNQWSV